MTWRGFAVGFLSGEGSILAAAWSMNLASWLRGRARRAGMQSASPQDTTGVQSASPQKEN